jgi:hypothetical protein
MSIEAMKQALDALEEHGTHYARHEDDYIKAITALRQAIEQAEKQEPVGVVGMDVSRPHMNYNGQYLGQKPDTKTAMLFKDLEVGTKLYAAPVHASDISQECVDETAKDRHIPDGTIPISNGGIATRTPTDFFSPPKREWVELTDEEREQLILGNVENVTVAEAAMFKTVLALQEAKLKEKNT